MAAQTYGSTATQTAVSPRVNLLPPEIAERETLRRAQLAMLGTGVAAVAVVGGLYLQASAKVSDARQDKAQAVAANAQLQAKLGDLATVKDVYAQVDAASKTLAIAMHYEVRWSTYLHDLTLTIPENVWLNRLEVKLNEAKSSAQAASAGGENAPVFEPGLGTVKVSGSAFSHDDVAAWLESLAKQRGYADAYFTKSEDRLEERIIVDFDSSAVVTDKARSNRYAKGLAR